MNLIQASYSQNIRARWTNLSRKPLTYTYTGDLNSHDRCKRAWAYEKHAHFSPPEQIQAVFGNLYHSVLEWLAKAHHLYTNGLRTEPDSEEFGKVLLKKLRMLRSQGIHSKVDNDESIKGMVLRKVYPTHTSTTPTTILHPDFDLIIKSAERTEVDLKAPVDLKTHLPTWDKNVFRDHERLHLRGIVDVVRSISKPIHFGKIWEWNSTHTDGKAVTRTVSGKVGDLELWDYKSTNYDPHQILQYVNQMLTYAYIYEKTHNERPVRCVLFFIGEVKPLSEPQVSERFLAIEADNLIVNEKSFQNTLSQVKEIQETINTFEQNPGSLEGGDVNGNLDDDVATNQCIICMKRWDCTTYENYCIKKTGKPSTYLDLYAIR